MAKPVVLFLPSDRRLNSPEVHGTVDSTGWWSMAAVEAVVSGFALHSYL
jgi:hypothetical protein